MTIDEKALDKAEDVLDAKYDNMDGWPSGAAELVIRTYLEAAQAPATIQPVESPLDRVISEPGEMWPKTLREHINAVSRKNVMVSARDVWRILDVLLPLIEAPKRELGCRAALQNIINGIDSGAVRMETEQEEVWESAVIAAKKALRDEAGA